MAPDTFPPVNAVKKEFEERLAGVRFERLLQGDKLVARFMDLRAAVSFRLSEMLEILKQDIGDKKIRRVVLIIGGDGYSVSGRTQKYGFAKGSTHRLHLAFKVDSIVVEDKDGKDQLIYVQKDLGSRSAATPIVIARSKESIKILRKLTADWSSYIVDWEKNGLKIGDLVCPIHTKFSGDEAFLRLLLGQTTASSMFVSMRLEKDEAFSRVLTRVVDKVDLARTWQVMIIQGHISDAIQTDGLTLKKLKETIASALHVFGDNIKTVPQFRNLVKVTLALEKRYPEQDTILLSQRNDSTVAETTILSSDDVNDEDNGDEDNGLVEPLPDKDLNESSSMEYDPSNISVKTLSGALTDHPACVDWFVGWLAGQKTCPLLPMEPRNVFPGLLHLLESVTRFLRDACCVVAQEANGLEHLLDWWCQHQMIGCTGPMEGNDCRAFLAEAPQWLDLLFGSDAHDPLEELINIFRRIYTLLRQETLEDEEKQELTDLCLRFAVQTNSAFPNSPWRNYLVTLSGELDGFINGNIPPARMAEDCFEHLIQGLKKCLTSCGGGKVTAEHREEAESQQMRRMMVLTNPLLSTRNVEQALARKRQTCSKCHHQNGHNARTCLSGEVRASKNVITNLCLSFKPIAGPSNCST